MGPVIANAYNRPIVFLSALPLVGVYHLLTHLKRSRPKASWSHLNRVHTRQPLGVSHSQARAHPFPSPRIFQAHSALIRGEMDQSNITPCRSIPSDHHEMISNYTQLCLSHHVLLQYNCRYLNPNVIHIPSTLIKTSHLFQFQGLGWVLNFTISLGN
jgi:hypothetical protein